MTIQSRPLCEECKHQYIDNKKRIYACNAYPNGIPMEIIRNIVDHRKPYKGDNGIQYEPKEGKS